MTTDRPSAPRRGLLALLIASLSLNAVGLGLMTLKVIKKGGLRYVLEQLDLRDARPPLLPFQEDWRARYREYPNTDGEIIFAGDSLMAEGPWAELYTPIKNRGIGGETTIGLLDRIDEITESRPSKIFLLVGTNCLAAEVPLTQIVRNHRKILERIAHDSPGTKVFLIGVLPINPDFAHGPEYDNALIRDLNDRLRQLADEFAQVEFLDASGPLTDARGNLQKAICRDGIHLTGEGYLRLGKLLEPYVVAPAK